MTEFLIWLHGVYSGAFIALLVWWLCRIQRAPK